MTSHPHKLVAAAASATAALTPAQARTALREADLSTPNNLAELAARARLLAANAGVLEVAAASAARTAGMSTVELGKRVGLTERAVNNRYTHHQVQIVPPAGDMLALVERDGRGRTRPVVLELNLHTKVLRLAPGTSLVPELDSGTVLRWPAPLLTGQGGATLLQALAPLALRILVGADILDTGPELDDDATAAAEEIGRACDQAAHTYPVLWEADAASLWAAHDPTAVATALGLSKGANSEQVAAAAELARTNALSRLCLLTGADAYLAAVVDAPPQSTSSSAKPAVALPHPALAPPLSKLVSALGPVVNSAPSPLGSERLRQICTELIEAVTAADPTRLALVLDQALALDKAPTHLRHLPEVAHAWDELLRAHRVVGAQ